MKKELEGKQIQCRDKKKKKNSTNNSLKKRNQYLWKQRDTVTMSQENVIYFKKGILKTKYPYKMHTQKKKKMYTRAC